MKASFALLVPLAALFVSCASPGTVAFSDGVRLYRDGYVASARDAFESAVHHEPRDAAAWNNRAVTRARLGDLDGAVLDYTRAMELAPNDPEIVFNRGNAYAAAGNLAAAINDFTTAATMRPDFTRAIFNRAAVRAVAGDLAGAAADREWAIEMEGDPWTKAAMRQASGLDAVYALPRAPR